MPAIGPVQLGILRHGALVPIESFDHTSKEFGGSYEAALRQAVETGRHLRRSGEAERYVVRMQPLNIVLIG